MTTQRCQNCGALLAPNAAWCFNCLQAVPGMDQDRPAEEPAPDAARAAAPTAAPPRPKKVGGALRPELRPRAELTKAEYSRWKAGPTSFGPVTKIALTVLILALLPFGGALGMQLLYLIAYLPIALLMLWGLWRKQQVG